MRSHGQALPPGGPGGHFLALRQSSPVSFSLHVCSARPCNRKRTISSDSIKPTKHIGNLICVLDLEPMITTVQF